MTDEWMVTAGNAKELDIEATAENIARHVATSEKTGRVHEVTYNGAKAGALLALHATASPGPEPDSWQWRWRATHPVDIAGIDGKAWSHWLPGRATPTRGIETEERPLYAGRVVLVSNDGNEE